MRRQIGWWWMGILVALFAPARPAAAECMVCTSDMWCAASQRGGAICLGTGEWCAMAGKCSSGRGFFDGFGLVQVSLFDDVAGAPAEPARVTRGFGPSAVGEQARRFGGGGALRFGAVGTIEGASAAFRAKTGDGFVLSREGEGRGAHVVVRTLEGEHAGRVLADERLGEHDVLRVRVPFDGRTCVLVVQAATLGKAEGGEREARCRRDIERSASALVRGATGEVPFELRALDE
ncbi:MAG: hypothetical protein U0704_11730 [Candidatus Eisenbacteria bacterium]